MFQILKRSSFWNHCFETDYLFWQNWLEFCLWWQKYSFFQIQHKKGFWKETLLSIPLVLQEATNCMWSYYSSCHINHLALWRHCYFINWKCFDLVFYLCIFLQWIINLNLQTNICTKKETKKIFIFCLVFWSIYQTCSFSYDPVSASSANQLYLKIRNERNICNSLIFYSLM